MVATTDSSRNSSSPAQIVGTSAVPRSAMRRSTASSANVQCSIESTPASTAFSMPRSAWQCAATCLWLSCAISTAARSSSSVNWIARESSDLRREHRAGGHHLHQVGAAAELPAGCGAHGVGPVGDLVHAGVVVGRRRGDRQQLAREEHARAAQRTGADGVAHVHLDVVPPADVAHRGDAGQHGPLGGGGGVQRDGGVAPAGRLRRVAGVGGLRQVDVAVDQAGQQVRTRRRRPRRRRPFAGRPGATVGDAITVDPDVGPTERARCRVVHLPTHQPAHGCGRYAIRT